MKALDDPRRAASFDVDLDLVVGLVLDVDLDGDLNLNLVSTIDASCA